MAVSIPTPNPRRTTGRAPDHSGIRLPVIKRRFVPASLPRRSRMPAGAAPLRTA